MTSATALKFPVAPGSLELAKRVHNFQIFNTLFEIFDDLDQSDAPEYVQYY